MLPFWEVQKRFGPAIATKILADKKEMQSNKPKNDTITYFMPHPEAKDKEDTCINNLNVSQSKTGSIWFILCFQSCFATSSGLDIWIMFSEEGCFSEPLTKLILFWILGDVAFITAFNTTIYIYICM